MHDSRTRSWTWPVLAVACAAAAVGTAALSPTVVTAAAQRAQAPQAPAQQAPAGAPSATPATPTAPRPSPFVRPEPLDYGDHDGWTSLFDGKTLAGWDGNPDVWGVYDGAISAESTETRRIGSTHIIWQGGDVADFELKFEVKLDGTVHSGIAYRSAIDLTRTANGRAASARAGQPNGAGATGAGAAGGGAGTAAAGGSGQAAGRAGGAATGRAAQAPPAVPTNPKWTLYGPGFDYDADPTLAGNVEDRGTARRELAWRGGMVVAEPDKKPRLVGTLGDDDELSALVKPNEWSQVLIIARGHEIIHILNGRVITILMDDDPQYFRPSGTFGFQIESFGFGRVNFRNVWLKKL